MIGRDFASTPPGTCPLLRRLLRRASNPGVETNLPAAAIFVRTSLDDDVVTRGEEDERDRLTHMKRVEAMHVTAHPVTKRLGY